MSQAESRRGQAPCQLFLAVRRQELVLDGGVAGQALSVHAPLAGITAPTGGDRAAMDGAVAREALQSLLRTEGLPRHATLHVVFEQPCLLHMTVPWSPQLLKADQAGSYVRRCAVESGWDLGRWQLQVDDAGFGQPRLAIAYPVAWLEALQAFTKAQGWQMGRVTGLSVLAWQEARRQSKAVRQLVLAGGQAPLFLAGDSRLESVHALSAPQAAREEDLLRLWQRLRWRQPAWTDGEPVLHGLHAENPEPADQPSEPAQLVWLASLPGNGPAALRWLQAGQWERSALDSQSPRPRGALLHGLVLAALFSIAAVMLLTAHRLQGQASALAEQTTQLSQRSAEQPAARKQDPKASEGLAAARRQLHTPYADLLAVLLPPRDIDVALLDLEFGQSASASGARKVKLQLEGRTALDMTRYMAYLENRRPLGAVVLTQHALRQDKAEERYRFTLELAWQR